MGLNSIAPRPRVYFDACIEIHYVERNPARYQNLRARMFPTEGARPQIAFSELVRLECRVGPLRRQDPALLARFDDFFALANAVKVEIDRRVFELATDLRATHRLKTPDALHLAAAITGSCDDFWTTDDRLQRAAENHLDITIF
ncbi:type II toxin-antitoxin system VapC family toxin [Thiorhodovibrio frisius]|uniref:Putative nucleic acid-binding protein n=1 Tax=Thiorhodovibrio frisius TaxID=631362 RepID=H8Z1Z2_9GAMM|nr:putative nucleic acid-binding protein [Thiorhodovibrio frisius]WPL24101.1 hypothetical protein Thiofri_04313 [Thiorhodovibrio frisius]